jgi:DEAD/DEAH box helicase domain-containing protein
VDAISAPELVYPEAVYLHDGETYLVRELDLIGKVAYVERRETDYYTQAVLESNVKIVGERAASDAIPPALVAYGDCDVTWQTVAFKKIKFATRENIGLGPVDIAAQQLNTTALWLAPDDGVRRALKSEGLKAGEGLMGLRNLAVVALPFVAMCDSRDVGGTVNSNNLGRPTMIVYDRYPGGLGYAEKGFARIVDLLAICREMVEGCTCGSGCPSCVGLPNLWPAIHSDPDLTRDQPMPDKAATMRLLELLAQGAAEVEPVASAAG